MAYCCICGTRLYRDYDDTGYQGKHEHSCCKDHTSEEQNAYCANTIGGYCSDCGVELVTLADRDAHMCPVTAAA
jgi:hypothetical protein